MRSLNLGKTVKNLINFIKTTVDQAGFRKVIVAVSGGVDSGCVVSLAVRALGEENVYPLLLPYKDCQTKMVKKARKLLDKLNVPKKNFLEINIGKAVDELSQLSNIASTEKIRLGNIMARTRMIVLFDQAKRLNALVLGTENKSEHMLGYFTRFGDEASDIEPLRQLYKTEVYQVANYLEIPREIINQPPSAGLWPGQIDEDEFGFTYKEADEVLWGLYDAKFSKTDLVKQGIKPATIEKVEAWVKKIDFKHHLPYIAPDPVLID